MSTQSPLQTRGMWYTEKYILFAHFHFTESCTIPLTVTTHIFTSYQRESTDVLLMGEFHLGAFLLLYMLVYCNGLLGHLMELCHH